MSLPRMAYEIINGGYRCNRCDFLCVEKGVMMWHNINCVKTTIYKHNKKILSCHLCRYKVFDGNQDIMDVHMEYHKHISGNKRNKQSKWCKCGKELTRGTYMVKRDGKSSFECKKCASTCPTCKNVYKTPTGLKIHLAAAHKKPEPILELQVEDKDEGDEKEEAQKAAELLLSLDSASSAPSSPMNNNNIASSIKDDYICRLEIRMRLKNKKIRKLKKKIFKLATFRNSVSSLIEQ